MAHLEPSDITSILYDLHERGAEAAFLLAARYGDLRPWFAAGMLVSLETPAGQLVILGPQGRMALGLRPNYRTVPEAAADQYFQRRCCEVLERLGWRFIVRQRPYVILMDAEDQTAYLLARWRTITAKRVRHALGHLDQKLQGGRARLIVHTDRPNLLMSLARHSQGRVALFCCRG
jgi:hypothetical protein